MSARTLKMDKCQLSTVDSQLREGYKQSEVGVIPEEWEVKMLGEKTTKIGSGITPTGGEKVYKSEGRPFLRSQNVGWGNLILEDIAFIDDEIHNTFKATEIEKNDVFLNITGASIGRSTIADERVENGNVNQHVCIIRTIEDELNPKFLNYFLLSKKGQKQIDSFQAGGNRQGLNFGQIKSFQIPLPPLHEQQAIASALSDVDALIAALGQLITKKRNIKQGAMQQLLTGEKRLPGFGGAWEEKRLGAIADIDPDNLSNSTDPEYSFHYISLEDVDCGTLRNTTELLFKNAPSRARRKIRNEDILLSTVRPNLKSHLLLKKEISNWICSTGFSVVRCRNNMAQSGFVFNHLFSSVIDRQIETLTIGSNYPAINSKDVNSLLIPLPPTIEEQTAIAQILSDMDTEIEALEQKQAKYKAIKQGMMQELLTGKTRLV